MNFTNNLKSPRASIPGMTMSSQLGDVVSLQQALLEKDQFISNLQGNISRLQLKNKQYSSYQEAMVEYQARAQEAQSELLKTNQKLRVKTAQLQQMKKKMDMQLKQKREKAGAYVRQQDYNKLATQFKKYKQMHKEYNNSAQLQKQKNQQVQKQINGLKQEILSLNQTISNKNIQINDLKVQKYNAKSSQSIQSQKDLLSIANSRANGNVISSFRVIGQETQNTSSIGTEDKINYQLVSFSRQNDELRNKCRKLQQQLQQYMHSSSQWSTQSKNHEYSKIIEEYELNMANMANRLSSVHKLQIQRSSIDQERRKLQMQCQQLRQQLASRINYCETLQLKIRQIQGYKGISMQSDMQSFVFRSQKLTKQVQRLDKMIIQKYEQIINLRKHFETLQITEQTFVLVEQNLNSLQQNLNLTKQQLRKQQDKLLQKQQQAFKHQKQYKRIQIQLAEVKSQMSKTNRIVSQHLQKIQFQNAEIKRLTKENSEKKQISQKLAKLQTQFKKLDKKYEQLMDQSNELAMSVIVLSAQIQRRDTTGNITKSFMYQFDQLKLKSKQTENHSKHLQERVKRLQHLHKQVVMQSMKISEHLHNSHKRWNHYETAMEKLIVFLQESEQRSKQRYEQIDSNINNWLEQQDKRLKQLAKSDPFEEKGYMTYTTKVTSQQINFD